MSSKKRPRQEVRPALADVPPRAPSSAALALLPAAAAVLGLVLLTHWPGLHANALSFDDGEYLTENPLVQNPSLHNAGRFLTEVFEPSTVHGYYQPLNMISLMVDAALGGSPDDLLPFHRTSLLLHAANTLLILLLIYRLFNNVMAAALVALLFGVHPMTVETIVWVGERKTVLAAFFAFASILAYTHYAGGTGSSRWWAYAVSVLAFVFALMSKPTVTPLPLCLLLLDFWPLQRLGRRAILEKLPYVAIALVSAYITFESQRRTAVAVLPGDEQSFFIPYVVCHNIVFYLWKMILPIRLSSHYTYPYPLDMSQPAVAAGVIGTILLLTLLMVSLRWTRALATGWLFFFIAIFPTLGIIGFTNVIASDKYAYWPVLGFLLILAWAIAGILKNQPATRSTTRSRLILAAGLLAAMAFAIGTRAYLRHWQTTESLFRYMASLDHRAAAPLIYLGTELDRQGRTAEALPILQQAAWRAPAYEGAHFNLANVLHKLGEDDAAIAAYERAIQAKPDFADAYNNMGNALLAKGDTAGAKAAYQRAIALAPSHADAHYNLANLLREENNLPAALREYETTLRLQPDHAAAHKNLAGVLWLIGQHAAAIQHYDALLRLQPDDWRVALRVADFLADAPDPGQRRPARAAELARLAVQATDGRNPAALATLALALDQTAHTDQAAAAARQAMSLALAAGDEPLARRIQQRLGRYLEPAPSQNPSQSQ